MLETGMVIDGKYKILSVIGRGGMSTVYLAINEKANKPWAIKEIRREDFRELEVDKKEIGMMKRLKHPHLPSIIDVIERDGSLLIVMDYIEGRSLDDILREQGAQTEEAVMEWAKQLADVLAYLHSRRPRIIYRDMKPANVMLKPDGNVMLIDFGAAREFKPSKIRDTVALGTLGYAAPEQYEPDGQSDERTDIYGLGVMLFELLTGENPHRLCPVRKLDPFLSAGCEAVILRCTQIKKEDRYRSCEELLYALEHYRELDERYRRRQKRKLFRFLRPAALAVVLGISAGVSGGLSAHLSRSNYGAFLLAAGNSASKEEELDNYRKAIRLDPYREDAYLAFLEDGLLDDQILTAEESGLLRSVLIDRTEDGNTCEQEFAKNKDGYARFSYEAGIAYYYKFEEEGNKRNAKNYFEIAAAADSLTESERARSERLALIAGYYSRIGTEDAAGDESVTYRDYWDDLTRLTSGNLASKDNERTALVVYEELVGQVVSGTPKFRDDGVEKEELLSCLSLIEEHLGTDFKKYGDERQKLKDAIMQARRLVESAYREV